MKFLQNAGKREAPGTRSTGFYTSFYTNAQTRPRIAQRGAAAEPGRTDLLTMCATPSCAKNVRKATHPRSHSGGPTLRGLPMMRPASLLPLSTAAVRRAICHRFVSLSLD